MDLSAFGPKDKKIIKDNEGVSPYDLLVKNGLSQKAYDKLIAQNESKILSVETADISQAPAPKNITKVNKVSVRAKNLSTGREFTISSFHAKHLNKTKYRIIG